MGVFSAVIAFGIVNGDDIVELLNLIIRYYYSVYSKMVHCLRMEVCSTTSLQDKNRSLKIKKMKI